ncbi:MAG: fibrobacter succinogenes major paralogous domain-containing protein [Bacteroidales bacterium]|nr:fibrobacter succinogenes major paralogous domain-containing protein [Bacteroidales bacterium]
MKIKDLFIVISSLFCLLIFSSYSSKDSGYCKFKLGIMKDIEGNLYKTISIGEQVWMLENLRVESYRNGDPIPNIKNNNEWQSTMKGAYCNYNNNSKYSSQYGNLYNWYAINDKRHIAPAGWHVPNDNDWQKLIDYLGGEDIAGGRLKERGFKHWDKPNMDAFDSFGFKALPGGIRYATGKFYNLGSGGYWWSSTEKDDGFGIVYHVYYFYSNIYRYNLYKELGVSVRCIKD